VMGEAEQVRHEHRMAAADADRIRIEAAEAARAAAEAALADETARVRAESEQRLYAEISRLRAEAEHAQTEKVEEISVLASSAGRGGTSVLDLSRRALQGIRWDYVATAGLILLVIVAGALYLPRAVTTAAKTSSALVGTAGQVAKNAAKEAVAAAPVVTRRALNAAERAIPRPEVVTATRQPAASAAAAAADADADSGPGFITAFSRIPMEVYADGKRIGTTEDGQLLITSGTHRLEFVSQRFHYRSSTTLTIRSGHVHPYTVALPTAAVRVTATPGSEIWVEGERVGMAPMQPVQVPIGTRGIVVKDPNGGERRQAVEVKYGETTEVSLAPQAGGADGSSAAPRLAPLSQYQPK
jgi:hypothetical protein